MRIYRRDVALSSAQYDQLYFLLSEPPRASPSIESLHAAGRVVLLRTTNTEPVPSKSPDRMTRSAASPDDKKTIRTGRQECHPYAACVRIAHEILSPFVPFLTFVVEKSVITPDASASRHPDDTGTCASNSAVTDAIAMRAASSRSCTWRRTSVPSSRIVNASANASGSAAPACAARSRN